MKKLLLLLTLFALPAFAGTLTLTTSTAEEHKLARGMARANRETCRYYGHSAGCTQAQARKEFCRRAGFGGVTTCAPDPTSTPQNPKPQICTTTPLVAACDGANQVQIFTTVQEFAQDWFSGQVKSDLGPKLTSDDAAALAAAQAAASQAQRDSACVALGLQAGCM